MENEKVPAEPKCCCECSEKSGKTTIRTEEERRKLINRLSRIEGQVRGLRTMVENDAYCNDILVQSAAVNAAINAFNKELLARHIRTCVVRELMQGDDAIVEELVTTVQKMMK